MESEAVPWDDDSLINGGIKAKVLLVLEFLPDEDLYAQCEGLTIPGAPGVVVPKLTTSTPEATVAATGKNKDDEAEDDEDDDDEDDDEKQTKDEAAKEGDKEDDDDDEKLLRLEKCFELFSTPEKLSPEDSW